MDDVVRTRQEKLARYLIKRFGKDGLQRLIEGFERRDKCAELVQTYGVTRQRIHQWKNTLGVPIRSYVLHPEVQALLPQKLDTVKRTEV